MALALLVLETMKQAATIEPLDFVEKHILSGVPAVCKAEEYSALTSELAAKLEVVQADVAGRVTLYSRVAGWRTKSNICWFMDRNGFARFTSVSTASRLRTLPLFQNV